MSGQSQRMVEDAQGHFEAAVRDAVKLFAGRCGGTVSPNQVAIVAAEAAKAVHEFMERNEPADPS